MRGTAVVILALPIAFLSCGCGASSPSARPGSLPAGNHAAPPTEVTAAEQPNGADACASRLHELAGGFLLYYATHQHFPDHLTELADLPGLEEADAFHCPVSQRRYIYHPGGVPMPEPAGLRAPQEARIILHDPAPSHSGMRWAITIDEPQPGMPLVTRVIALPESFFVQHLLR